MDIGVTFTVLASESLRSSFSLKFANRLDTVYCRTLANSVPSDKVRNLIIIENLLVHQWAHLRWGVFDEYASIKHPRSSDPNHLINFYTSGGSWKPVTYAINILVKTKAPFFVIVNVNIVYITNM